MTGLTFNERVKSSIPDIDPAQALAMISDFATSKEFKALKSHQQLYIAALERYFQKEISKKG